MLTANSLKHRRAIQNVLKDVLNEDFAVEGVETTLGERLLQSFQVVDRGQPFMLAERGTGLSWETLKREKNAAAELAYRRVFLDRTFEDALSSLATTILWNRLDAAKAAISKRPEISDELRVFLETSSYHQYQMYILSSDTLAAATRQMWPENYENYLDEINRLIHQVGRNTCVAYVL